MPSTRLILVGLLLLLATGGIVAWQVWRPSGETAPPIAVESLMVVCRGRVDSTGQVRSLDPLQPGKVVEIHVSEGQAVKAGDPIISLDDRIWADALKDATFQEAGAKLELQVAKLNADAFPSKIEAAKKEIEAAEKKLSGLTAKLAQMRQSMSMSSQVPVTQADLIAAAAEIDSLNLNLEAYRIRVAQFEKADPQLEVKAAQLKVDAAADMIKRAERQKADCVIRAPSDGTILRLQTAKGAMLAPGMVMNPAIVFLGAGQFIVRAELDQADLDRVKVGMPVNIQDDARRNSHTWTGRVTEVAGWIAMKRSIVIEPGDFNDVRTTEVVITLDPTNERLYIGQRMVVRFGK